jgi:asparagine synthase (glutamine-hydrolysing)
MVVDAAGPKPEAYWEPDVWMTLPYTKDEDYVDHYRNLFADVVRRMSRSNLPVAYEVSGGLDSSAIFAMAENLRQKHELPAPAIEGYVLAFHDDADANELEYSRSVGKHLGLEIQEILPDKKPISWYRDWARRYRVFPGFPNGVMALSIREKARSDGSRVLLAGVGGDEWVDGSRAYYAEALATGQWRELYRYMETDCREVGVRSSIGWLLRAGIFPLLPTQVRAGLRKIITRGRIEGVDRDDWLTPSMRHLIRQRRAQYVAAPSEKIRRVGQRSQLNMLAGAYSMLAREMEERLSSHTGLELRRPFWDARIVQFAFATPERLRVQGRMTKTLHRQAMFGLLPDQVLTRETKADFMVTFRQYLPDMKKALTQDIPTRHPDWIRTHGAYALYEQSGNPKYSGWPEWMLWTLFGCDAVA